MVPFRLWYWMREGAFFIMLCFHVPDVSVMGSCSGRYNVVQGLHLMACVAVLLDDSVVNPTIPS